MPCSKILWIVIIVLAIGCLLLLAKSCVRRAKQTEYFDTTSHSKKKICICMFYTPNISSYSKLSEKINRAYAKRHGYAFVVFKQRLTKRDAQWDKVAFVDKVLNSGKYHYVFWIDSDAYFNLQLKRLEDVIEIDPAIDLYICDDLVNSNAKCLVNTGTFLLRNSSWSRNFMRKWWNHPHSKEFSNKLFHEQTVLDKMIKSDPKLKTHIRIYPAEQFNSIIYMDLKKIDCNFIVHLMSRPAGLREQKMREYLEEKIEKK